MKLNGILTIGYMTYFDNENFLMNFNSELQASGSVDDAQVAAQGELGQRMHRYCSKHMHDIEKLRVDIIASMKNIV